MDRKWWLVIAGCITHAVNTGFSYFGMSAFFPSFEREFGWSRTAISGAFSLARVESGILGPIEGYLTDRIGAQRMLFIGLIICTLGFVFLSFVDSLPTLYLVIILGIVLGSSLGYNMPISVLMPQPQRSSLRLCMMIYSLAYGGLASLQEPIRADYFGTKAFATIQGASRSVTTAGAFMGPIIAGLFFYDLTKSYMIAFTIFAGVSLLAMACMYFAKPPAQSLTESRWPRDNS
jgi:MFS family permease